jgi:hypothetical protein
LFTGIGGLRLVCGYQGRETTARSMCCQRCQLLTLKRASRERTVFHDVTKLSQTNTISHLNVEMITSVSCQDISGANPYAKATWSQSKLILKSYCIIVRTCQPSVQIRSLGKLCYCCSKGLDDVLVQFQRRMNFHYVWTRGFATEVTYIGTKVGLVYNTRLEV